MNAVKVLEYFESQRKAVIVLQGLALIAIIGTTDYLVGNEIGFSIFFVLPIATIAWTTGRRLGYLASILSAAVWLWADLSTSSGYSHQLVPVWNSLIRLGFFIIITKLLTMLQDALRRESELARIDHLTGAANARSFHEIIQLEIDRCERFKHPFTLAYIDLDNFKVVNDQLGHSTGNLLLRAVVDTMRSNVRKTDFVGRIGGDEFAILFSETGHDVARVALQKIHQLLNEQMQSHQWPVTFSIGAVTCNLPPPSADALLDQADKLMYAAKKDGKNTIRYQV